MGKITFCDAGHVRGALNHALANGQERQILEGMRRMIDLCASYIEAEPNRRNALITRSISCIGAPARNAVSFDFLVYDLDEGDTTSAVKAVLNGGLIYHPIDRDWSIHT